MVTGLTNRLTMPRNLLAARWQLAIERYTKFPRLRKGRDGSEWGDGRLIRRRARLQAEGEKIERN
jgi:hypothetical protein